MDNLGSPRGKAVRRAIRKAGAKLLFLPKYSPDLNPIEQFFSKLEHAKESAGPLLRRRSGRHKGGPEDLLTERMHQLPQELRL